MLVHVTLWLGQRQQDTDRAERRQLLGTVDRNRVNLIEELWLMGPIVEHEFSERVATGGGVLV
jgi:hypothetical protein